MTTRPASLIALICCYPRSDNNDNTSVLSDLPADNNALHPTHYTLHTSHYTLHTTPYISHPTPFTLPCQGARPRGTPVRPRQVTPTSPTEEGPAPTVLNTVSPCCTEGLAGEREPQALNLRVARGTLQATRDLLLLLFLVTKLCTD